MQIAFSGEQRCAEEAGRGKHGPWPRPDLPSRRLSPPCLPSGTGHSYPGTLQGRERRRTGRRRRVKGEEDGGDEEDGGNEEESNAAPVDSEVLHLAPAFLSLC